MPAEMWCPDCDDRSCVVLPLPGGWVRTHLHPIAKQGVDRLPEQRDLLVEDLLQPVSALLQLGNLQRGGNGTAPLEVSSIQQTRSCLLPCQLMTTPNSSCPTCFHIPLACPGIAPTILGTQAGPRTSHASSFINYQLYPLVPHRAAAQLIPQW